VRLALALVPLLAAACTPRERIVTPVTAARPPAALRHALRIESADGVGFGAALSSTHVLTVAHLAGTGTLRWRAPLGQGTARLLWRDDRRDLAMFTVAEDGERLASSLVLAKRLPEEQERVWWRAYLLGGETTTVHGYVLGIDTDDDVVVDGWGHPGMSGAPLLNDAGELLGIMKSSGDFARRAFPGARNLRDSNDERISPVVQLLLYTQNFRPVVYATPLRDWPTP